MNRTHKYLPIAMLFALASANQAYAQTDGIGVTLEVLDDVSEIDAVVMRLQDARERDEVGDQVRDEERERDQVSDRDRNRDGDRAGDGDLRDEKSETDRDERREVENEERDLERDFDERAERDRQLEENPVTDAVE